MPDRMLYMWRGPDQRRGAGTVGPDQRGTLALGSAVRRRATCCPLGRVDHNAKFFFTENIHSGAMKYRAHAHQSTQTTLRFVSLSPTYVNRKSSDRISSSSCRSIIAERRRISRFTPVSIIILPVATAFSIRMRDSSSELPSEAVFIGFATGSGLSN